MQLSLDNCTHFPNFCDNFLMVNIFSDLLTELRLIFLAPRSLSIFHLHLEFKKVLKMCNYFRIFEICTFWNVFQESNLQLRLWVEKVLVCSERICINPLTWLLRQRTRSVDECRSRIGGVHNACGVLWEGGSHKMTHCCEGCLQLRRGLDQNSAAS